MKRLSILLLLLLIITSCSSLGQQTYSSHKVKAGETVSAVANAYNVTVYEIYRLNPEARDNFYPGLVLVLPGGNNKKNTTIEATGAANNAFVEHTVKKGETLYSLSKKYGVSQEEIKRYNTQLYSAELRLGDTVKIPVAIDAGIDTGITTTTKRKHVVKPKETIYGLARMYGTSVEEIRRLNPEMDPELPIGSIINVPDKSYTKDAKVEEERFGFYEVKQGETLYALTRRLNLTKEDLIKLNPALEDGLKNGMVLKLPKSLSTIGTAVTGTKGKVDLSNSLTNLSTKRVALLLPFNVEGQKNDSIDPRRDLLKHNGVTRIALDFYSGALMAIDSAKSLGISTDLFVYDTKYKRGATGNNTDRVRTILSKDEFDRMDAVIGPLLGSNVEEVSQLLKNKNIPVVSPITPKTGQGSNLFQSRPTDDLLRDYMLEYIGLEGIGKNVIIIADAKNSATKDKLMARNPGVVIVNPRRGKDGYYLNANDISSRLSSSRENWIVLETNDIPLISNTITNLGTLVNNKRVIKLMTSDKGSAYESDDISNMRLMQLNFHFPSVDKQSQMKMMKNGFSSTYRSKYGIDPNNYAVRGFDLTLDILLRLASAENLYASADSGVETQYIENKFNYVRGAQKGFYNDGVFILRYAKDLEIEEVEVPTQLIEKLKTFKN